MSSGRCYEDENEALKHGAAVGAVDEEYLHPPLKEPKPGSLRREGRARMLSQHQRCIHCAHDLNQDQVPRLHSVPSPKP